MLEGNTGTRRLRIGALRAREHCAPAAAVSRKDLIGAARDAARGFAMRPAVRQVLGELVACYGEQPLERGLMVWPSNDYLCQKTGLTDRAIRRIIAEIVDMELLRPADSPNRKRFAIRGRDGEILDAYGFDLAPLWGRRAELEALVERQKAERLRIKGLFDEITIARGAVAEALRATRAHFPTVNLDDLGYALEKLDALTPRRSSAGVAPSLVTAWKDLRDKAELRFEKAHQEKKESGSAGPDVRHKEQNNGPSSEPCKRSSDEMRGESATGPVSAELVIRACPAVLSYAAGVTDLKDLERVGAYLRASIGAHPDAWREAVEIMGPTAAAVLVIYVLQIHEYDQMTGAPKIQNPGGLYRTLARKAGAGAFELRPALHQLVRRRMI